MVMAAMTQYGEIMLPKEASTSADSKWIVPACRLTKELGCVITWDRRGMRLNFPSGAEIKTKIAQGLCSVSWEDFKPVREALGKKSPLWSTSVRQSPSHSSGDEPCVRKRVRWYCCMRRYRGPCVDGSRIGCSMDEMELA